MRNRTEPAEPNRNGPSHGVSEKRRPNRGELEQIHFRTEPNRTDESPEPKRIEPNRFLPVIMIIISSSIITRIKNTCMAHGCMCLSVNDRTGGSRRVGVSTQCAHSRVQYMQLVPCANLAAPIIYIYIYIYICV